MGKVRFGRHIYAQCLHYCQKGFERWVAMLAERAIKLFTGKASLFCQLTHSLGPCHDADGFRNIASIACLQRICHEMRYCLRCGEVIRWIEFEEFLSHFASSTNAESGGQP